MYSVHLQVHNATSMSWSRVLKGCWKISIGNAQWFIGATILVNLSGAGSSLKINFSFINSTSGRSILLYR
ncbi:hypothetical protein CXF81_03475 [Glaciecola sp. 33A]|nr:hypothetical protein CXF81_03475 [Glaciecola sp. 33A]